LKYTHVADYSVFKIFPIGVKKLSNYKEQIVFSSDAVLAQFKTRARRESEELARELVLNFF